MGINAMDQPQFPDFTPAQTLVRDATINGCKMV
jgi:hypothetical protein